MVGYVKDVCKVCGKPEVDWGFCLKHLNERNERNERVRGAHKR